MDRYSEPSQARLASKIDTAPGDGALSTRRAPGHNYLNEQMTKIGATQEPLHGFHRVSGQKPANISHS